LHPAEQRPEQKIDAAAALMMAIGRAMAKDAADGDLEDLRRIMLDVDDTFGAAHGGHQLRLSDVHEHEHGFQPIAMFDGKRRPVTAGQRTVDRLSATDLPLVA
jgi:hypothetical protein